MVLWQIYYIFIYALHIYLCFIHKESELFFNTSPRASFHCPHWECMIQCALTFLLTDCRYQNYESFVDNTWLSKWGFCVIGSNYNHHPQKLATSELFISLNRSGCTFSDESQICLYKWKNLILRSSNLDSIFYLHLPLTGHLELPSGWQST